MIDVGMLKDHNPVVLSAVVKSLNTGTGRFVVGSIVSMNSSTSARFSAEPLIVDGAVWATGLIIHRWLRMELLYRL